MQVVLVLAIHLCSTLAIKAIEMFNECKEIALLVLKPCCLPGRVHVHQQRKAAIGWAFSNGHHFFARDLHGTEV